MPRRKSTKSTADEEAVTEEAKTEEEPTKKTEAPEKSAPSKTTAKKEKTPVPTKTIKRPVRRVTFEQWARRRGVKTSHMGGMKAFVPNPNVPRSMQIWDKVFEDY